MPGTQIHGGPALNQRENRDQAEKKQRPIVLEDQTH
jgi:hypothetical protein